ncbi:hypothetical protein CERSUDRAFT_124335 [Gelatoporia subvermispora B]|uniref:NYN domain-containing protein n=1 Tax=Ceriporiopsis subvermispora (strain B) TaxID=914234 RepID=M2RDP0_CERS8|nr:hypothetical protein CERSUDRAFT_124335 [Gelatoporia subvermispora B]
MASDTTFSPTPFSPFSSYSVASGVTSDDAPDLGAFTTVFRALNTLQPRAQHLLNVGLHNVTTPTSLAFSPSEDDSDAAGGSTVWSRQQVASYLSYSSPEPNNPSRGRSPAVPNSDTTASDEDHTDVDRADPLARDDGDVDVITQPSLGYLDSALGFIAAERAKLMAQRENGARGSSSATTSDNVRPHVVPPRRKRRRKRNKSTNDVSRVRAVHLDDDVTTETAQAHAGDDTNEGVEDAEGRDEEVYSSSPEAASSSSHILGTPVQRNRRRHPTSTEHPRLHHSKSTPSLRLHVSMPFDAQVIQLRTVAHKLRLLFPQDAATLSPILALNESNGSEFVDPRGPVPQSQDALIHVFVDHSNILIGFLTYLRRHLRHLHRPVKHMSHAALALILERGRPITRRVLVTSSPLYQPMESAVQLGYEVRIYARVPDTGDGPDRQKYTSSSGGEYAASPPKYRGRKGPPFSRGHSRKGSAKDGATSESDHGGNGPGASTRVRYREQGVDELLQLKLHQALAEVDDVPPGATIVLATGDGNVGQFSEEGFLGVVRTALKKGWRVELYAWEGGLSRAWMREFGEAWKGRFEIHMLDRYAVELLEV